MAVASTIANCGLNDFYQLRNKTQSQVDWEVDINPYLYLDHPDFEHEGISRGSDSTELSLSLIGLNCAACAWLVEKYLREQIGVDQIRVNQISQRAVIKFNEKNTKPSEVMQGIAALGYQATLDRSFERSELLKRERKKALMRLGVAAIGMMQVGMYAIALHAGSIQGIGELERDLMRHAALIICTLIVFYSASPFFRSAWLALKHKSLVMDVPVSIAILAAYSASLWSTFSGAGEVYFDSVAMFTFFLLLSRFLEAQARSQLDIQPVQSLLPDTAILCDAEGEKLREIATGQLVVGNRVIVEPGAAVPADLSILSGKGEVDESILSGEFNPVTREAGDELVAGSMNGEGRFIGKVIRVQSESSLAIVDQLYENALQLRSASEALADRIAVWFIAVVLGAATLTYLYWLNVDPQRAFWIMLSVLVVSCPCALSLATPTSITAAIFALRSRGILIRHSSVLDQLPKITDVIFDKTGTLTEGRARIKRVEVLGSFSEQSCMAVAASLEAYSSHPFARAFTDSDVERVNITEVKVVPGAGVQGLWEGLEEKQQIMIGNRDFIDRAGSVKGLSAVSVPEEQIPIYLATQFELLAVFYLEDPVRASAGESIEELSAQGIKLHLLSGDPTLNSQRIAQQLGIPNCRSHFSAKDKLEYIERLKAQGRVLMFVGDGINDVPAMGAADVSLVVAQATDLVQARADIGLVVSDLRLINRVFDQGRRLSSVLRQNISWAIVYNLGAMPAAALGFVAPWLAAIGMSLSSVVVVLNALRLKRLPEGEYTSG